MRLTRTERSSAITRAMSADPAVRELVGGNAGAKLEATLAALQRRIRDVHRLRQSGGDAYHAEMDAIATELGGVKLELRGWAPRDHTTWRPSRV